MSFAEKWENAIQKENKAIQKAEQERLAEVDLSCTEELNKAIKKVTNLPLDILKKTSSVLLLKSSSFQKCGGFKRVKDDALVPTGTYVSYGDKWDYDYEDAWDGCELHLSL